MAIPSTHISLLRELEGASRSEAWAAFHARYRDVILRWCRGRGVPRDCAEDLTQDVFLLLAQRLPQYHHEPDRGRFRSWLQAVVHNVVTDFWRRQRRRPGCVGVGGSSFLERLAGVAGPEEAGELSGSPGAAAAEAFDRARARLKETTWQAFYLSTVEKLPAAEVAARLNLSVASVYKANYRVKQILLEEYRRAHEPSADQVGALPLPGDAGEAPA
jgi:RNA polymerase sigma-70 factor (ECF subfamily)